MHKRFLYFGSELCTEIEDTFGLNISVQTVIICRVKVAYGTYPRETESEQSQSRSGGGRGGRTTTTTTTTFSLALASLGYWKLAAHIWEVNKRVTRVDTSPPVLGMFIRWT